MRTTCPFGYFWTMDQHANKSTVWVKDFESYRGTYTLTYDLHLNWCLQKHIPRHDVYASHKSRCLVRPSFYTFHTNELLSFETVYYNDASLSTTQWRLEERSTVLSNERVCNGFHAVDGTYQHDRRSTTYHKAQLSSIIRQLVGVVWIYNQHKHNGRLFTWYEDYALDYLINI